jgi:hypothetical protein
MSPTYLIPRKDAVYWCEADAVSLGGEGIVRWDRKTRQARSLAKAEGCEELVADDTHLYWVQAVGPVGRVSLDGGPPEILFRASSLVQWFNLAHDRTHLYWTDWATKPLVAAV